MATIADWLKIDAQEVSGALLRIKDKLDDSEGELVLDFSTVRRIDAPAIAVLEQLADTATARQAKVILRGVTVDVYKVLKLARLTTRFTFLN